MIRRCIVLCAILAASAAAPAATHAQALIMLLFGDKIASETFIGGINAGLSMTTFNHVPEASFRISWSFGAFMEWDLGGGWIYSPEMTFKTPAGSNGMTGLWSERQDIVDSLSNPKESAHLSYVTIPLLVKYEINAFRLFAGPKVGYVVAATDNITGTGPNGARVDSEKLSFSRINRWDVGIDVGLEYLLNPDLGLRSMRLNLRYYQGFLDVYHDDGITTTNHGFYFNLGIPIGGPSDPSEGASE